MNNLEIINNENSNNNSPIKIDPKKDLIKETIESKGIPILAQEEESFNQNVVQYYKTNFPEYKIYENGPLLFITIGDLTTCPSKLF